MNYGHFATPQGEMFVLFDEESVHGIYFDGQKYLPDFSLHQELKNHPLLDSVKPQLVAYFSGQSDCFDFPLAVRGTPFQRAVWQALREIPCGETCSYMDVAIKVGNPRGVRAVAQAIGHNPWSVVIPCHRVIGTSGKLTGYAGGINRKAWLLKREGVSILA